MSKNEKPNSPLNDYQIELLKLARNLHPSEPPPPWGKRIIIPAAGVLSAGWDKSGNILLISVDGYSISNPSTGERLVRDRDYEKTFAAIVSNNLRFQSPETQELIDIFGIHGGDGIHFTQDRWTLGKIYPWWPEEAIIIQPPFISGGGKYPLIDNAYLIKLIRLDGWLKSGFSPSGQHFAIVGSGGAEVFSR